jgi:hypothetical protein
LSHETDCHPETAIAISSAVRKEKLLLFMKKPEARGPSPSEKAHKALGQKLNRPPKPPPTPDNLPPPRRSPASRPVKGE